MFDRTRDLTKTFDKNLSRVGFKVENRGGTSPSSGLMAHTDKAKAQLTAKPKSSLSDWLPYKQAKQTGAPSACKWQHLSLIFPAVLS